MMKRNIPWREVFHLKTYPTYIPVLLVLLLTVLMPIVGHCKSPGKLLDEDLIDLVPPDSNDLSILENPKRKLNDDPDD